MIASIIGNAGVWIGGLIALIAGAFGLYKAGHAVGTSNANEANAKAQAVVDVAATEAASDNRIQTMKGANDVEQKVSNLDSGGIADELQQYARPADAGSAVQGGDPKAG